ncbi:hypothetical protein E4U31_005375 [Claviceps sp. LM219 group G6]|nr:hypothetical protein E4U31_005375 [Claviceps sp. LM219 group G6]
MPHISTHSPGRTTQNTRGQDPSPSDSLPVHPVASIDVQRSDEQEFQDRLARAEATIAMATADAPEAEARASAAMHDPQPTLNLDTVDDQPADPAYSAETWGDQGFPEIVCTIARDLEVAAGAVYQVYIGEFEPLNLLRLHPTRGWFVYEIENESTASMDHSPRSILLKKKFFTAKDYGETPSLFTTAFSNHIVIYYRLFGDRRLDVVLAQLRFLSYILEVSEYYNWEFCLEYAMRRLTAIRDNDVHDVAEWHS